jgi:hypothetical protein
MKCEITTSLFSWRERHILGLQVRPSPYLKILVTSATGELVVASMAFLTYRENFIEVGFLSGVIAFCGVLFHD